MAVVTANLEQLVCDHHLCVEGTTASLTLEIQVLALLIIVVNFCQPMIIGAGIVNSLFQPLPRFSFGRELDDFGHLRSWLLTDATW
jgi:hypothetical protein